MNKTHITYAAAGEIPLIQELTMQVWPQTYQLILTEEQIQYMLDKMYSTDSLQQQMQNGQQFLIAWLEDVPVGFASWGPADIDGEYKLHKLYVRTDMQKTGAGKALLWSVMDQVKTLNGHHLILQVNRQNENAIGFYLRMGFRIEYQYDFEIGNGFYMNDYIMGIQL
jgi:GNAT superfamily N-acetyltransferase